MLHVHSMIDTFIKMHRIGVSPIAILQKMATIPNMQVDTLRAFVDHCHAAKWHLHEQAAKAIVSGFEQHQTHTNIVKQKVYADMEKYGIDVDAIRQKAASEGYTFNPLAYSAASEQTYK